LRLPGRQLTPSGIEELPAASPRPAKNVASLAALAIGHPSPLVALVVAHALAILRAFLMVAGALSIVFWDTTPSRRPHHHAPQPLDPASHLGSNT
jgi:hypothetical protein